ncbi:unnamed protein product [Rotaria socialis]|nr:unnamed protein product [Rotaria socialis]CAF3546250.1 unnamed protein product [Rotaria socialis]CAF4156880.1 unnamed protein product [Rotaria socialis]CAF4190217.1 unnamed protein product [Rotaria socialis]CAF4485373.1 unnamed protein product [Rotaria socialis]
MSDLEHVLGYRFKNKDILKQSLTHASALHENHPKASYRDQSSLAFVGDAVLKYAVARYLLLNGRDQVVKNSAELHKGTQTIIPNAILAKIAHEKLHLEEHIIRGNAHVAPSEKMHADCMEAILGAIALDCGVDQQKVIFDVIEKLCSDRYQTLLKPIETIRLKSACDEEEEDYINVSRYVFLRDQARPLSQKLIVTDNSHKRTHWQKLGQVILWLFAICGFLTILWLIANFIIFQLSVDVENQGWEF